MPTMTPGVQITSPVLMTWLAPDRQQVRLDVPKLVLAIGQNGGSQSRVRNHLCNNCLAALGLPRLPLQHVVGAARTIGGRGCLAAVLHVVSRLSAVAGGGTNSF